MRSLMCRFVTLALLVAVMAAPALAASTSAAKSAPAAPAAVESLLSGLRWPWPAGVQLGTPAATPAGRAEPRPVAAPPFGPRPRAQAGGSPGSNLPHLHGEGEPPT